MIAINVIRTRPDLRRVQARRALSTLINRVPMEGPAKRLDRRIFRWVLCGEHGFGRNWRETCPVCAGYVEHVANPRLSDRFDAIQLVAEDRLIAAAAFRHIT